MRRGAKQAKRPPMLLKIAPDLRDDELEDIAAACGGGAVDGIIVSNTTLSREGLRSAAWRASRAAFRARRCCSSRPGSWRACSC